MISRISTRFASKNLTRLFSAQINSVPGNKPPVVEGTVEGRYAGVLFKLSSKNSNLSKINDDMEFLHTLIQESKDFSNFLANGAVKKRELNEVFAQINADFDELTIRFLDTVIDNKRAGDLPKIAKKFVHYYKLLNKEEAVTIISAKDLTDAQRSRVSEALREAYSDTTFNLKYEIDPTILGGLQLYFGDSFLDCSLATRLSVVRGELRKMTA